MLRCGPRGGCQEQSLRLPAHTACRTVLCGLSDSLLAELTSLRGRTLGPHGRDRTYTTAGIWSYSEAGSRLDRGHPLGLSHSGARAGQLALLGVGGRESPVGPRRVEASLAGGPLLAGRMAHLRHLPPAAAAGPISPTEGHKAAPEYDPSCAAGAGGAAGRRRYGVGRALDDGAGAAGPRRAPAERGQAALLMWSGAV